MKLQDLIAEERVDDYIERLTKTLGIKQLGEGYYSSVFQHPVYHNVVVKLCRIKDPETIRYLKRGAKHPDNPWFPKIVGIHTVKFDRAEGSRGNFVTHIVFMQKLSPARKTDVKRALNLILDTLPDSAFQKDYGRPSTYAFLMPRSRITSLTDLDEADWEGISRASSDPHVRQLAALLGSIGADDIHDANIMVRDDGHPVITDPVASDETS